MKKLFAFLFVALLALCLVACGGEADPAEKKDDQTEKKDDQTKKKDQSVRDVKVEDTDLANVLGSGNLYVTTFGQATYKYMQEVVDEAISGTEITYTQKNLLTADEVKAGDVVIAVVGYTSKGIDTKTITVVSETARAEAFAKKDGITLVIVQLDGKDRRGESSDPIIAAATAGADYVFVFEDGKGSGANYDSMYSTTWCKDNKHYFEFSDEWEINTFIAKLVK